MTNNKERLLEYITNHPGLDDDELSSILQISPRQTVNIACRTLEFEKLIIRNKVNGKIRNFAADQIQTLKETTTEPKHTSNSTQKIPMDKEAISYFDELEFLISLKESVATLNNRIHSRAVRLALKYLKYAHPDVNVWDTKEGSDSGVDLVGIQNNKIVVVGEVKTTIPYYGNRLGAAQAQSIKKDFDKIQSHANPSKYFFVLDDKTLDTVIKQFQNQFMDVKILSIESCYS